MDWLDKATAAYCKLLELLLVVLLAAMVLMVRQRRWARRLSRK